jgi:VanZ family protein
MPMEPMTSDITDNLDGIDKVVHFLMFGIFSFLIVHAFEDKGQKIFLISATVGIFYAAFGEFIQSFLPTRSVSLYDFYTGAIGSLFFVIYYYVRTRKA